MIMRLERLNILDNACYFLNGTQTVIFSVVTTKKERYRWVQKSTKSMNGLEKRYDTGADCTRCSFGKKMY
jgi:hypothetical protein